MEGGDVKEESTLQPGFRFHPSDEELISYYLTNKISDSNFTGITIGDVDLNKWEPWDLPGKAKMGEKEWYFFSLRDRKYPTGVRTNRATKTGYWKTTGKDKEIYSSSNASPEVVGMKKTLVFYRGRAPRGEKTNWVMHEYRIHSRYAHRIAKQNEWVVCRVFQKSPGVKRYTSAHSRAVDPFAFNDLELPQHQMQPQMVQPGNFPFPVGRSYITPAGIQEFDEVLRGGSASMIDLPILPQANYNGGEGGGGCFTISGLNLNLGGGCGAALTQPLMRPAPPTPPPQMNEDDATSSRVNSQSGGVVSSRFMAAAEHFAELESYWPTY